MTATVRPARSTDGPDLYQAWQALRQHYAATDPRIVPTPVSEDEFLAGLRELFSRETAVTFVAEEGGQLVGFVSGGIEQNQPDRLPELHATVGYIYVEPSYRRGGLGRQLFQAVAEWANAQEGISHFEMAVLASDDKAAAFWQTIGFSPFIQRLWAPLGDAGDEP